jgi:uncharacterized protein (TIGR02466 family)
MRIPADDPSTTLHALFPTLVYQASLNNHSLYRNAFEQEGNDFKFPNSAGSANRNTGEYHGKILLHQSQSLRPFFETLAQHVGKYLGVLGMKSELFDMQCLKSWFVICCPEADGEDNAIVAHNHSCSDISWVYYFDVPDDCSALKFHAGRRLNTAVFDSSFHYDWHDDEKSAVDTFNWWNSDTWSIHPKNGDLVLFPGHQLHSVDANHSDSSRISIAGDIALTLREEFTDREFGRTASKHWLTLPLED